MTGADLKRFALLEALSDEDREAIFELCEPQTFRKGRSLYRETAEADGLLLLVSGRVRLSSRERPDLGTLAEGAILGGASLVSLGPREAAAKAEVACEVMHFPRSAYRRLVEDYPRTACRLTEALAGDLANLLRESIGAVGADRRRDA